MFEIYCNLDRPTHINPSAPSFTSRLNASTVCQYKMVVNPVSEEGGLGKRGV
jgi:hypothetical protein